MAAPDASRDGAGMLRPRHFRPSSVAAAATLGGQEDEAPKRATSSPPRLQRCLCICLVSAIAVQPLLLYAQLREVKQPLPVRTIEIDGTMTSGDRDRLLLSLLHQDDEPVLLKGARQHVLPDATMEEVLAACGANPNVLLQELGRVPEMVCPLISAYTWLTRGMSWQGVKDRMPRTMGEFHGRVANRTCTQPSLDGGKRIDTSIFSPILYATSGGYRNRYGACNLPGKHHAPFLESQKSESALVFAGCKGPLTPLHRHNPWVRKRQEAAKKNRWWKPVVIVLRGRKRWVMFPPRDYGKLDALDAFHEVSSNPRDISFWSFNAFAPGMVGFRRMWPWSESMQPWVVDLNEGDVLLLTSDHAHHVYNLEDALGFTFEASGPLRRLVTEESEVQLQRKEHFLSSAFTASNAGDLFPSSWAFSAELPQVPEHQKLALSNEKVDLKELRRAVVVFDKSAEDGTRFRVYRLGNLEVRSTWEYQSQEVVGAVYTLGQFGHVCKAEEKTLKLTVASVESASATAKSPPQDPPASRKAAPADERKKRLAKLIYSGGSMRADREVVLSAVEEDGLALRRASEELRGDREIVQAAVQERGGALEYASEQLRGNRDVVLAALELDGCALEHASEELRGDRGIAAAALHSNSFALKSVAPSLRSDRELVLRAVQRNAFALEHASSELVADRSFLLAAVQKNALILTDLPLDLRADRDFMLQVVQGNGFALKYASDELRADGELISAALRQDSRAIEYADRDAWEKYLAKQGQTSDEGFLSDDVEAAAGQ